MHAASCSIGTARRRGLARGIASLRAPAGSSGPMSLCCASPGEMPLAAARRATLRTTKSHCCPLLVIPPVACRPRPSASAQRSLPSLRTRAARARHRSPPGLTSRALLTRRRRLPHATAVDPAHAPSSPPDTTPARRYSHPRGRVIARRLRASAPLSRRRPESHPRPRSPVRACVRAPCVAVCPASRCALRRGTSMAAVAFAPVVVRYVQSEGQGSRWCAGGRDSYSYPTAAIAPWRHPTPPGLPTSAPAMIHLVRRGRCGWEEMGA